MKRLAGLVWTGVWVAASLVLAALFYNSYWRWRGCFNEEGRCWTGEVVHHDQSVYLALPLAFCVIAALIGVVGLLRSRSGSAERT